MWADRLRGCFGLLLIAHVLLGRAEAQSASPDLRHVRWPLLDIVMVPDSGGLWFVAGPNPWTTQWSSGSHLIDLCIDPIVALQWASIARRLAAANAERPERDQSATFTPPLSAERGSEIVVLGTNPDSRSDDTRFVLFVSDSANDIRWKSFVSSSHVEDLVEALEATARDSREGARPLARWSSPAGQEPDTPVRIVSQPRPAYPGQLASRRRVGRVWMSYVVNADGRVEPESFFPLLSDDSLFTKTAIDALRRSRFRAATTKGQPVPQLVFQAIVFRDAKS
jgi:Gram-negative bacterial TonB protein C-terminal